MTVTLSRYFCSGKLPYRFVTRICNTMGLGRGAFCGVVVNPHHKPEGSFHTAQSAYYHPLLLIVESKNHDDDENTL